MIAQLSDILWLLVWLLVLTLLTSENGVSLVANMAQIISIKHYQKQMIDLTRTEGSKLLFEGAHEAAVPAALQALRFRFVQIVIIVTCRWNDFLVG